MTERMEDEMNQIILNMENSITPKAIPVIVPGLSGNSESARRKSIKQML